jgi:hypothetical protein
MAHNVAFGEAVRQALGERTYREVAAKAGVAPSTVGTMVQGFVPRREKVIAFAQAVEADPNPLLEVAGYDPVAAETHPAALFWDEVRQLNEETGAGIQVYLHEGSAGLTVERVRGYVQAIRNTLKEEGLLPQKGEP